MARFIYFETPDGRAFPQGNADGATLVQRRFRIYAHLAAAVCTFRPLISSKSWSGRHLVIHDELYSRRAFMALDLDAICSGERFVVAGRSYLADYVVAGFYEPTDLTAPPNNWRGCVKTSGQMGS